MRFQILTLFPKIFESFASQSIIGRARENSRVQIEIFDLRDFSKNKHKKVDSPPFGGGAGMILQCEPVFRALEKINPNDTSPVIFFTPAKNTWNQKMAEMISRGTLPKRLDKSGRFAGKKIQNWILLCGHYGGIDQRILDVKVDAEISVGKFILTGGELPGANFFRFGDSVAPKCAWKRAKYGQRKLLDCGQSGLDCGSRVYSASRFSGVFGARNSPVGPPSKH